MVEDKKPKTGMLLYVLVFTCLQCASSLKLNSKQRQSQTLNTDANGIFNAEHKSDGRKTVSNFFKGHPSTEYLHGEAIMQNGHDDIENVQKRLSAELEQASKQLEHASKEIQVQPRGDVHSKAPMDKVKAQINSLMQNLGKTLLDVNSATQKVSDGEFAQEDAKSQKSSILELGAQNNAPTKHSPVKFDHKAVARFKTTDWSASFGGGGCISTIFQTAFLDIMDYAAGINKTTGKRQKFFNAITGTSGGSWTLGVRIIWGERATPVKCTLMDPDIGFLPAKERTAAMLKCLGCGDKSLKECNQNGNKIANGPKVLEFFGSHSGCISVTDNVMRLMKIPAMCAQLLMKTGRVCGAFNIMFGLTSTLLLPPVPEIQKQFPQDVLIQAAPLHGTGQNKHEELLDPKWGPSTTATKFVTSTMDYRTWSIPKATNNQQLFDNIMYHRIPFNWTWTKETKMNTWQFIEEMSMTANMPVTGMAETIFLVNQGLCKANPQAPLKFTDLLGFAIQNMLVSLNLANNPATLPTIIGFLKEFGVVVGTSDVAQMELQSGSHAAKDMREDKARQNGVILKYNVKSIGNGTMYCLWKDAAAWFKDTPDNGNQITSQSFFVPCAWENEEPSIALLQPLMQPTQLFWPEAGAQSKQYGVDSPEQTMYHKHLIGDSGSFDPVGLATAVRVQSKSPLRAGKTMRGMLSLNSEDHGTDDSEIRYFEPVVPIKNMFGPILRRLKTYGADCSKTEERMTNPNYILKMTPKEKLRWDCGVGTCTDEEYDQWKAAGRVPALVQTVENDLWTVPAGVDLYHSTINMQTWRATTDKFFLNLLPKDYAAELINHDFPGYMGNHIVRDIYMATGMPWFEAFSVMVYAHFSALGWLCERMTTDACPDLFEEPLAFLNALRDLDVDSGNWNNDD